MSRAFIKKLFVYIWDMDFHVPKNPPIKAGFSELAFQPEWSA